MQVGDAATMLRGIPLFSGLDASKLKLLAFASDYLTFEPGQILFSVGEPADCAYVVEQGEVEIWAKTDGHEVKVGTLGRHELVGEMAIFRNARRSATIRAVGRVKVLRIDAHMFLELVTQDAGAATAVMRALSEKLVRATEQYEQLEERVRAGGSSSSPNGGAGG